MKRVLLRNRVLPLAFVLVATAPVAFARQDVNRPAASGHTQTPSRVQAVKCLVSSSKAELDVNNVRAMVLNGGDMWWNLSDARYEVPKVLDPNAPRRHSIFAGAIWVGGKDPSGTLYVAAQTYRQGSPADAGFWPGPLNDTDPLTFPEGQITEQICNDWNAHAKINRSDINAFRQNIPGDPNLLPQVIKEWPGTGNPYLNREAINVSPLAPFVDVDANGIYDPMGGDYPDIRGDQAIWWVMNDKGNVKEPLTPGIGLELAVQAFAFQTNDLLNNMTFYKQRIANKSNKTLQKAYIGQWVDPDLGYFNDDYVGCDVARGLGFCYNGDNLDEGVSGYGANPPAVGVDFFEGPLADANDSIDNDRDSWTQNEGFRPENVDEPGEKIIMSNFVYYNNDFSRNGNPTQAAHFYNYLQSKITTGVDLKFGGDGVATAGTTADNYAFMFAGAASGGQSDPFGYGYGNKYTDATKNVLANNATKGSNGRPPCLWSENNTDCSGRTNTPADRRFLQSAGPFTLRPGAVNNITIGVIWAAAGAGGAQGSLALLTYADDQAQIAFDKNFEIADGPPPPIVKASEMDQQVVLSIQPSEVDVPGIGTYNTETYHAIDSAYVKAGARDAFYNFEGYLVYQLANSEVSASDVNDLNKARLVARGDIINGVGQIINYEFDVTVNQIVPKVKVNGDNADQGVFHTLNLTSDQFAEGNSRLVNFKRYTFMVIPYAYNADTTKRANGRKIVENPYLQGRFATKITVIPHKVIPERNGTVLNAGVYDQVPITRLLGTGTGGKVIEITPADEEKIISDGAKLDLNYQVGKAPVNVRVYDPKLAKDGDFKVKFSTRLTYLMSSLQGDWEMRPGDRLVSLGQYRRPETRRTGRNFYKIDNNGSPQVPGVAIVNRVVSADQVKLDSNRVTYRVTLDIEMLNDDHGGTFMASVTHNQTTGTDTTQLTLLAYEMESRSFRNERTGATADAEQFNVHDFWKWQVNGGAWKNVTRRVSEINEELIPEYGLSIQVKTGRNPGYQPRLNTQTSFLEASLTHTGKAWLTGVPYEQSPPANSILGIPWLLPVKLQGNGATTEEWDPNGTYSNILPIDLGFTKLGGTWAAYTNVLPVNPNGAGYVVGATKRLYNLRNVDIVFTNDKSKWTRAVVLQLSGSSRPDYLLTKKGSTKPSIDKEGNPTGQNSPYTGGGAIPSTGVGWFPGYAIDLDRGVRLNIMFAESSAPAELGGQGPVEGADLIWSPGSDKYAGRNFVYVTDTQYDEAKKMEAAQDSVSLLPLGQVRAAYKRLYDRIMYVGYPKIIAGTAINEGGSTARVRIRVDRQFTSYPSADTVAGPNKNPEYGFSLKGQAVDTMQTKKACDALALVRVVPNPYYAFSQYEQRQLDNIAKITNLPKRADVTVYTLNGTLVRRLRKDDRNTTFIDFNMKNDSGLPIASGVYLFHISAPDLGCETVVKWFGIMRPIDLDTF